MTDTDKPDTQEEREPVTHSLKGSVQIDLTPNPENEEVEDDG